MRSIGFALLVMAAHACDGAGPGPSGPSATGTTLLLDCPPTLILGQATVCVALSRSASGQLRDVSEVATWRSSAPNVVAVDGRGRVTGISGGSADISASFEGAAQTARIVMRLEDALIVTFGSSQYDGKVGSRATLGLGGYYAAVSARGGLTLQVRDDVGGVVASSGRGVEQGGGFFTLYSEFVMPANTSQVCAYIVLIVDGKRYEEPQGRSLTLNCTRVQP